MSESIAWLQAEFEHGLGDFQLCGSFALHRPWTVLFGPSGAGKSTLLRILAGLVRPDRGKLLFGDRVLFDTHHKNYVPPGKRQVGFLGQSPSLFPHLSVAKNIVYGLHGLPAREQTARLDSMLTLFHIEALASRRPEEISGGERQRVGLARALAPEPRWLLLDEPFAALDASLKDEILTDLTHWLRERNIPSLYVSHDLAEAYQTGAEVLVLRGGRIEAQGPAETVLVEERARLLRQLGVGPQR